MGYAGMSMAALRNLKASRYAYRFLLPLHQLPPVLSSASTSVWLGQNGHMVHYPLADGHFNLVVMTHGSHDKDQRWALVKTLLQAHPWLEETDTMLSEDKAHIVPLPSWPRCDSWIRGSVVITGDSAHQMPPHLAQILFRLVRLMPAPI